MGNEYYETWKKYDDGKWCFIGWGPMMNEKFCVDTKENEKSIIKTYKWLGGTIEVLSYRK